VRGRVPVDIDDMHRRVDAHLFRIVDRFNRR
jgi:hypothetical protein